MRIGSLFSGAGGLDMAVEEVFAAAVEWNCETDPAASAVLDHHWPGTPNLGDVAAVDWALLDPVDVICGGFPCQDLSLAGKRAGLAGSRSGLWRHMREAVEVLQPRIVVVENVLGLAASGAIDDVTANLVDLGYGVRWTVTSAASVAAPHRRRRVFIVAQAGGSEPTVERVAGNDGAPAGIKLFPTPEAKNSHAGQDFARSDRPGSGGDDLVTAIVRGYDSQWSQYGVAIRRWEQEIGRPAPHPTEPTSTGNPRINPEFPEWMMGWPAGWVTEVPGVQDALFGDPAPAVDRADQLKICGNGVVTRQAANAIRLLMEGTK